ncbi:HupE/UreJ family protein [Algiphilus aromaticivorans]|uniref:HupE/UreJ family protein n=1 Tax=Algiphilus aromaticivorans TaxID=382454 RepID=UPI000693F8FA|nr:HupE/UreJ family protein [Algiphilus aromaticivorans]
MLTTDTPGKRQRLARLWRRAAAVLLLMAPAVVAAHPLDYSHLEVTLGPGQTWTAVFRSDLTSVVGSAEAYHALAEAEAGDPARAALRAELFEGIAFRFDGQQVAPVVQAVRFPELDLEGFRDYWERKRTRFELQGIIPRGAEHFNLSVDPELTLRYPLVLVTRNPAAGHQRTRWLTYGEDSDPVPIGVAGAAAEGAGEAGAALPSSDPVTTVIGRFLHQGFIHILPLGLDHIAFVLGLFLYSARWKPLLGQVTGFTLAHSLTLGLALYGLVSLPARWVEILIAASIVYVAFENLLGRESGRWRFAVVFGFGLLHGLGFAGALMDLELTRGEFLPALFGFNVGVEVGQLAVLALAWLAVGWMRHRSGYRRYVVVPGSLLIGLTGVYWVVERVFFW